MCGIISVKDLGEYRPIRRTSMSYSRSLSQVLEEKNSHLYSRMKEIEKLAEPLLTYTAGGFPFYTPHGFSHSKKVVENLNWLIPDDLKPQLNDYEIFFMIIAAWMHDWGMVCKPGEKPEEVRKIHHVRTEENFEELYDKLKLDKHEALIIGRISRGHRIEDLRSSSYDEQIFSNNIHINIRFLTALVRIADECDITYNRVPELIYYSLNPKGTSEEHFKQHLSIGGMGKDGNHKIKFNGVAYDPKGSQTLNKLRDKIQKELDHVKVILTEKEIPLEYVECKIDARGFVDKPISFKLDEKKITELLIGNSIYSRSDVAIRELLQNSIDACRYQKSINPTKNVWVRIFKDDGQIIIEDNGIGMDYEIAKEFLSKKGFSFYNSDEIKKLKESLNFDPISKWGLGFLSCFLIASSIEVETRKNGKTPCKFIISGIDEGWRYEESIKKEDGTKIVLTLNENGKKIDLDSTIRYYAKSSTVPVFLGKDSKEPLKFNWSLEDSYIQDSIKRYQFLSMPNFEKNPLEYEDEQITIKYYEADAHVFENCFLANQGFFVKNFPPILPFSRNGIFIVDTKSDILDLDISRDSVNTQSEKFTLFAKKWMDVMINFIQKKISKKFEVDKKMSSCKCATIERMLSNYGITFLFDHFIEKKLLNEEEIPQYVYDPLWNFPHYLILNKNGFKIVSLKEIADQKNLNIKLYLTTMTLNYNNTSSIDEKIEDETSFLIENISTGLKNNEIVLILFPFSSGELSKTIGNLLNFLYTKNNQKIEPEFLTIQKLVAKELVQIKTELDSFLPKNAYFTKMPKQFAGAVLCSTPYVVKIKKEDFFDAGSAILGLDSSIDLTVIKEGSLVFDYNDDFIQFLLSNQTTLKTSNTLSKMIKNYFRLLASYYYCEYATPISSLITDKEDEIISTLNSSKKIGSYISRKGKLNYLVYPTNPINRWMTNEGHNEEWFDSISVRYL